LYTRTPADTTVVCADELGPLIPRAYPAQPGWTADGNRVKEVVQYWRDPEKTWVYGGLRIRDGHAVTMCADRRNSLCYQDFLQQLEADNPTGDIVVITDNLSSHTSVSTREWLTEHPRIRQVFIPKNACWLNLQEPWWRMSRRQGLAGQELANPADIHHATTVATAQLNAKAKPWIWGRPPPPKRAYKLTLTYRI
jgi:DDE superfamily endonuclease